MTGELEKLGLQVCPSQANYLLVRSGKPLTAPLLERGILIRDCANYEGLGPGWYRFAVKSRAENRVLLDALMLGISCPASAVTSVAAALWLPLLSLLDPGTALYLLPLWLLAAGSASALAISAVLLPAFRRMEEKNDDSEDMSCQS